MDLEATRRNLKTSVGLSNEALSDQEESVGRELLGETDNTVSSSYAEILRIHPNLQSLEEQRAEELGWIARLTAGMSLWERIPPEILGYIFELCMEDKDYVLDVPLHLWSECLVFPQVCSQWRQVALAQPGLWNTVSIDRPHKVHPDALDAILSRAGHSIKLYLSMVHITPPFLRVIHKHSDNIHTLELKFDFFRMVEDFEGPPRLGALQKLRLYVIDDSNESGPFRLYPAISAFSDSSNSQQSDMEMVEDGFCLEPEAPPLPFFPWSHLQRLVICCDMPLTELLHILARCTQLKSCRASLVPDRGRPPVDEIYRHTLILMNITSLELTSYGANMDELLNTVVAPSLQVLQIKYTPLASHKLLHFIQRSRCNIRTIRVAFLPSLSPDIERLLLSIPNVVKATLIGLNIMSEATLDSISTQALLPNVEVLKCCVSSCRAIRELVLKRCEPSADGSKKVIRKLTARILRTEITDEWRTFQASLPADGALRVQFEE